MNTFSVQNGQFWLDDQPVLIQAGEFHYFRAPKDQWAHRLEMLKQSGFNAVAAYIPWLWHQLDEDVFDFDGHTNPIRDLAGFLDLAAEMGFLIIARPGPYIMAETINEGVPQWVFRNYPQVAFVNQENKAENIASYLHPDFLVLCKKWYQGVFTILSPRQITRGGKIIMLQLDNEIGMIAWVRNIIDTNPDTIVKFASFLEKTYGQALSSRYPVADLSQFLCAGILQPSEPHAAKIVEDYRRFYRDYIRDYAKFLWDEARSNGIEVPPVINIHGFTNSGKTFPIGLSQLIGALELDGILSATDVYPLYIGEGNFHQLLLVNEMTKALQNPAQPLFSIEFQAGGNPDFGGSQSSLFDLHTRLCIAGGMRAINHYLFIDGENDPLLSPVRRHDWGQPVRKDGTPRKHYGRYRKLSQVLASYGSDLVLSQPKTVATIGFFLDHYMTEVNSKFTQDATSILSHQRDTILFDFLARGLALTHRPFNAIELTRADLDASQTPLLLIMIERQCDPETQQKLVDYIRSGGKLILVGRMCIEDFEHNPCTILKDAVGIRQIQGGQPFVSDEVQVFNTPYIPVSFLETYSGEFDEVFATRQSGEVAGFIKSLGKGRILVFGAAMTANTLEDLDIFHQMALKMDCPPLFTSREWADLHISTGENGNFLFINNYQDDPLETIVESNGVILFDGNLIRLPARSGAILPLEWKVRDEILVHYTTSEIKEIIEQGSTLTLQTVQPEFFAEMTLAGYTCEHSAMTEEPNGTQRVKLHCQDGQIVLQKT